MKRATTAAVLVGLVGASTVLAGCSNRNARSQEFYTPADGVNATAGQIAIRNIVVVEGEDGLSLLATFVPRNTPDELVGVTIGGVDAVLTPSSVDLPVGTGVTLGLGELEARAEGLEALPGTTTEVAFTFAEEAGTSVEALILSVGEVYGTDTPSPRSATADPGATQEGGTIEPTPTLTEAAPTPTPTG